MLNMNATMIEALKQKVAVAEKALSLAEAMLRKSNNKVTRGLVDSALICYANAQKDLRQATRGYRQTYPHPCAFRRCSSRGRHSH